MLMVVFGIAYVASLCACVVALFPSCLLFVCCRHHQSSKNYEVTVVTTVLRVLVVLLTPSIGTLRTLRQKTLKP